MLDPNWAHSKGPPKRGRLPLPPEGGMPKKSGDHTGTPMAGLLHIAGSDQHRLLPQGLEEGAHQREGLQVLNAVGLNPTSVPADAEEANRRIEGAKRAIERGAVAVGEIGIDLYHKDSEDVALMQQATLANLSAYVATKGLSIVLHALAGGNNCKAEARSREVLQQSVPHSQKIQLHCFDSGLPEHRRWMAAFPETMLSLSGKLLKVDRHPELDQVVQVMALDQLLIETDRPHLCQKETPSSLHGPTSIRLVADIIGELRSLPPSIILEVASKNARNFFGF